VGGILKYSCYRPPWSSQTLAWLEALDVEEGLHNLGRRWEPEAPALFSQFPSNAAAQSKSAAKEAQPLGGRK